MAQPRTDQLDLEALRQFDNLELMAKHVVEGFITGLHKSPFHGFSVEFAEHRHYNPGEPTRHIDWKLYARTERLYTKQYEEETNLRCQLLIDTSSSMMFPRDAFNKLQFSTYAAAALIKLLQKQRDAVGLTTFAEQLQTFTAPRSNSKHVRILYHELEKLLKADVANRQTATTETLHTIAEAIHKRSLIVLFSDMMDNQSDEEALFSALQHLKHNKHEVIIFHVMDKQKELEFAYTNRPYQFVDLETGEKVKLFPSEVREQYNKQINDYRQRLKLRCQQYGIEYVEADINEGFHQVLMPYLIKRKKLS